jgi:ribosomal protein S18 acetylase RimI-like enzyme
MWEFINTLSAEKTFILLQGEQISLEDETQFLDNLLKQIADGTRVQLVVFSGDKMVGNADITLNGGVQRHVGGLGIAISDGYRSAGVGGLLMELLISEAAARFSGLQMIILEVFSNNPIAINLYRKLGFVEYGRLPNGIIHREQLVDAVFMVKTLRTGIDTFESKTTA